MRFNPPKIYMSPITEKEQRTVLAVPIAIFNFLSKLI